MNWRLVFRELTKRHRFSPQVIWKMTMPEVLCYLEDDDDDEVSRPTGATIYDVRDELNRSRAERGLPPIEIRTIQ